MNNDFMVFVKTETTGFPDFQAPSDAPHQPHIVSLCAIKVNVATREIVGSVESMIKPDGWEIPEGAASVHGITTDLAAVVGRPEAEVMAEFNELRGDLPLVCHSAAFQNKVLRIAAKRFLDAETAEKWKSAEVICTAAITKPIVQVPAAKKGFKNPTLPQAYQHLFGRELVDANSAVAAAHACKDVFFEAMKLQG